MLGSGELVLLLGSAALIFGPKDIPRIARAAGRLTGRAVGTVTQLRARAEAAMGGAAASEVHRDLRESLAQLSAIRDEIRAGVSPLSHRALHSPPLPGPAPAQRAPPPSVPWKEPEGRAGPATPFPFLPISAAALGRLPTRQSGQSLTGADIMMEAVAEESVATEANRLVSVPGALDAAANALRTRG